MNHRKGVVSEGGLEGGETNGRRWGESHQNAFLQV